MSDAPSTNIIPSTPHPEPWRRPEGASPPGGRPRRPPREQPGVLSFQPGTLRSHVHCPPRRVRHGQRRIGAHGDRSSDTGRVRRPRRAGPRIRCPTARERGAVGRGAADGQWCWRRTPCRSQRGPRPDREHPAQRAQDAPRLRRPCQQRHQLRVLHPILQLTARDGSLRHKPDQPAEPARQTVRPRSPHSERRTAQGGRPGKPAVPDRRSQRREPGGHPAKPHRGQDDERHGRPSLRAAGGDRLAQPLDDDGQAFREPKGGVRRGYHSERKKNTSRAPRQIPFPG
jgi:hypothetical protein